MSGFLTALAWLGLFLGLGVLHLVTVLLNRVLKPIREIRRYADDTLAAGLGIAGNLDGADEAAATRELALALPGLVRERFGEVQRETAP